MAKKLKPKYGLLKSAYSDNSYNQMQLKIGIKIEMEHTRNKSVAKRITKHHLDEFPNYYTELIKMENRIKKKEKKGK